MRTEFCVACGSVAYKKYELKKVVSMNGYSLVRGDNGCYRNISSSFFVLCDMCASIFISYPDNRLCLCNSCKKARYEQYNTTLPNEKLREILKTVTWNEI